jgi:hypothetical protein
MNTSQANQSGKTGIQARKRSPATKARTATDASQPITAKNASVRGTTSNNRRQNMAGAPYYRGLHWDF